MEVTQESINKEFITLVEERVLDEVCAWYKMDWSEFIEKVQKGWNPEVGANGQRHTAPSDYTLNCYRLALKGVQ